MFNLDDPKNLALVAMGLGLLGGAPRQNKNFGADLAHGGLLGLQAYGGAKDAQSRRAEEEQQRQMRQMQMDEMKRASGVRGAMTQAAQRNFQPGMPQMLPTDYETPSGPAGPGTFNMQGYATDLMRAGPEGIQQGIGLLSQLRQQSAPIKLGKDDRLVNPLTHKEVLPAAPGEKWEVVGRDPLTKQNIQRNTVTGEIKAVGSMPPNVNTTILPGERQEAKDLGTLRVKGFGELQATAASARKENAILSAIEKLPIETGKLTPLNSTVAAWLTAAGAKDEDLKRLASGGQAFSAFASDLVMQKQIAQKGPQTESDAKRLQMTQAQLGNEADANRLIITFQKVANDRLVEQERFYANWLAKHKTLEGADQAWFDGKGGKSLWDEPALKRYQDPSRGNVIRFDRQGNPL